MATQLKRGRWQSPPPKQIGPGATAELSVVGSYFIDLKAAYARYGVERVIDGKWLGAGDLGLFVVNDRISMPGHNPADFDLDRPGAPFGRIRIELLRPI